MEDEVQRYEKIVIQLRKNLAELELKRSQSRSNLPDENWQVFADVSYRLDQAEQKVKDFCQQIINDLNHTRSEITESLEGFIHLQEQIRNIEDQFMLNIVRPGYQLKKAIQQREFLEAEYHRIYKQIQRAGYTNQVDLEQDIRHAISTAKANEDQSYEEYQEEIKEDAPDLAYQWMNVDEVMEEISKEELIKEFRRVVLPAIHPDTSNTPAEVFTTVYDVYKKEDTLMMEAYIIQYRGEIVVNADADPLENLDRLSELLKRQQRIATRLQRRVDAIKKEIATLELEHPEKVQDNMRMQRQEILKRIQSESEQILYWREQIEGLVKVFQTQSPDDKEEL
jgi:hypothetical protein